METLPFDDSRTPWILRRARPGDAEAFARMMAAPEVYAGLMQLPFPDAELWRARLSTQNAPDRPDLHLVAEVDGVVVGSAGLHPCGTALRRRHAMSLGMAVDLAWQGRGVGSALMAALCMFADRWLGVLRLELTVFADNAPAVALYRKFGFESEGRMRGYAMRDGDYVDALCMARLHARLPAWHGSACETAGRPPPTWSDAMAEPRMSTEEEIEALDAACQRMAGFDDRVSLEWLDGYMTALLAGPRRIDHDEWLPLAAEGVFERTFADPEDVSQARAAIDARWQVLADQLDPESLLDDPDVLRLAPLMLELTEEDKQRLVAEGHVKQEEIGLLEQTGEAWAVGFMDATRDFPKDWPEADVETEEGQLFDECMLRVVALTVDEEELKEISDELFDGEELTRDELIQEACYAAQDMRLYWLDHAPRPAPRKVDALPGRNDLCPCGSGKKFKKCHGAQMQ